MAPSAMRMPISAVRRLTGVRHRRVEPTIASASPSSAERAEQRRADAARQEGEGQRRRIGCTSTAADGSICDSTCCMSRTAAAGSLACAPGCARSGRGCRAAGTARTWRLLVLADRAVLAVADDADDFGRIRRRRSRAACRCRPTGSSPAKWRRTNSSLITITTGRAGPIGRPNSRPRSSAIPIVEKYSGPTRFDLVPCVERLAVPSMPQLGAGRHAAADRERHGRARSGRRDPGRRAQPLDRAVAATPRGSRRVAAFDEADLRDERARVSKPGSSSLRARQVAQEQQRGESSTSATATCPMTSTLRSVQRR